MKYFYCESNPQKQNLTQHIPKKNYRQPNPMGLIQQSRDDSYSEVLLYLNVKDYRYVYLKKDNIWF